MTRKKQIFSVSPVAPSVVVAVKSVMKYDALPPKLSLMNDSTTTKPLKGIIKNKKMPVLPKIDFNENYNREDEENCSDSDVDDIKLHDTKQVLPFEDVRAYDGHMDKISPNERRYVIEKIQLGFELMRLEATRIQAKIDAANLRCAKLKKLAEEQEKVIANSTYLFSQTTPSSKEEEKSTDAAKKVMKRKKKKNVGLLLGETKDKFSQSTDEGYASKAAATPEANDKTIKMLKKKKNVKVKKPKSQQQKNIARK